MSSRLPVARLQQRHRIVQPRIAAGQGDDAVSPWVRRRASAGRPRDEQQEARRIGEARASRMIVKKARKTDAPGRIAAERSVPTAARLLLNKWPAPPTAPEMRAVAQAISALATGHRRQPGQSRRQR